MTFACSASDKVGNNAPEISVMVFPKRPRRRSALTRVSVCSRTARVQTWAACSVESHSVPSTSNIMPSKCAVFC